MMADVNCSDIVKKRPARSKNSKNGKKFQYLTGAFTNAEKEIILSALHTYGANVDKITPLISSRSREQVRDFLTSWYRRVKKVPVVLSEKDHQTSTVKMPIELWLDKIKKESDPNKGDIMSPCHPSTLGYIAKFEKHPEPSQTGGVDFRKLYEFLESALKGNIPQDLGFYDSLFVLSSLRRLKLRLDKVSFFKDEVYLKRSNSRVTHKTYNRIKKEPGLDSRKIQLEEFLSSKVVNPLNMPMESLSVQKRLLSQLEEWPSV